MSLIILNGRRMTDKTAAHAYIKRRLRFPEYYGANLDALADCLGELGRRKSIVLINADRMRGQLGDYAESLLEVFKELSAAPDSFSFRISGE